MRAGCCCLQFFYVSVHNFNVFLSFFCFGMHNRWAIQGRSLHGIIFWFLDIILYIVLLYRIYVVLSGNYTFLYRSNLTSHKRGQSYFLKSLIRQALSAERERYILCVFACILECKVPTFSHHIHICTYNQSSSHTIQECECFLVLCRNL